MQFDLNSSWFKAKKLFLKEFITKKTRGGVKCSFFSPLPCKRELKHNSTEPCCKSVRTLASYQSSLFNHNSWPQSVQIYFAKK